ncbi:hypothetical protein Tco_0436448 [Tanacetum coccineum]
MAAKIKTYRTLAVQNQTERTLGASGHNQMHPWYGAKPTPNAPFGCCDEWQRHEVGDGDDGEAVVVVMVIVGWRWHDSGGRVVVATARDREWVCGSNRSGGEEAFWSSQENSAGKVFRWPEVVAGGGMVAAGIHEGIQ